MPQTCQPGRPLRQIACRSARAVWIADGCGERQRIARHGTAVVVEDDGQPRLLGLPTPVFQPDVQFRMIGLPDGVGAGRLVAVDQVEGVGIGLRPPRTYQSLTRATCGPASRRRASRLFGFRQRTRGRQRAV